MRVVQTSLIPLIVAGCTIIQEAGPGPDVTDPRDLPLKVHDDQGSDVAPEGAVEAWPEELAYDTLDLEVQPEVVPDVLAPEASAEVVEVSKDLQPDGPCIPDCFGKICGPDGCGSICGFCPYGQVCNVYGTQCKPMCTPNCANRVCGPDGCEGFCGPPEYGGKCAPGYTCNEKKGTCEKTDACMPDCAGRECGNGGDPDCSDNQCGTCAPDYSCTDEGHCIPGPCAGVDPKVGACKGSKWLRCAKDASGNPMLLIVDCAQMPDKVCGWDPWSGQYGCIDKPPCVPSCIIPGTDNEPKECGDDGCGNETCGKCPEGWGCPGFHCRPVKGASCGYITAMGYCWSDNWLYWCTSEDPAQGVISAKDCTKLGKVCAYVQSTQSFECI